MSDIGENIQDNIYEKLEKITLETFGLFLVLVTVILALITAILVVFELYGTGRLIATFTLVTMSGAFVSLGVYNVTKEDD
jgi:H+/Cl- antiporter ClcA